MKLFNLLFFSLIFFFATSCGEKESNLDPEWNGVNETFSPKKAVEPKAPQKEIKTNDKTLREMAENLYLLLDRESEELRISEGLTFGATLLHYLSQIGTYQLNHKEMMTLIKGFEDLTEEPVDEKIMVVIRQLSRIKFTKKSDGSAKIQFFSKNKEGIIYHLNEKGTDPDSNLEEIKYVHAENGAIIHFNAVDTFSEREELYKFVTDTGSSDSIHPDIPKHVEEYLERESPSPIVRMVFDKFIVRVLTRTIWKHINFKFKYGYSIPLFRVGDKKIPGIVVYLKKNLAKVKISIDQ